MSDAIDSQKVREFVDVILKFADEMDMEPPADDGTVPFNTEEDTKRTTARLTDSNKRFVSRYSDSGPVDSQEIAIGACVAFAQTNPDKFHDFVLQERFGTTMSDIVTEINEDTSNSDSADIDSVESDIESSDNSSTPAEDDSPTESTIPDNDSQSPEFDDGYNPFDGQKSQ